MKGILLLLWLFGLVWSGQGVWTWLTNMSPTQMDCQTFLDQGANVQEAWVELENCFVDNLGTVAVYEGSSVKSSSNFYIPLMGPEENGQRKPMGFYQVNDEATSKMLYQAFRAQKNTDDLSTFWEENPAIEKLVFYSGQENIKGIRVRGADLNSEDKSLLADDVGSSNFSVISRDEPPVTLARGLVFLLCAGLLVLAVIGFFIGDNSNDDDAEPQAST